MSGSSPKFGAALRSLVERINADVESAFPSQGLVYRAHHTPVTRPIFTLGPPCSAKDIALHGCITYLEAKRALSEMEAAGLVRPWPEHRKDRYRFTSWRLGALHDG
jgi:hypothetical protein